MESWFKTPKAKLDFLAKSNPSQSSLLNGNHLDLLVTVLNWMEKSQYEQLKKDAAQGMTLMDCTKPKAKYPIHDVKQNEHELRFADDANEYVIEELARGDVDGDGYEDALIMVSGIFHEFHVLSKTSAKSPMKIVSSEP
jgi:hypothetical protein